MFFRWTSHLETDEQKKKFEQEIRGSRAVLDRLLEMVKQDADALERSEEDQRIYDRPNWDVRQAHKNGVRQYAKEMIKYIDLDQQKEIKSE